MAQKSSNGSTWTSTQAYVLAVICLLVGGVIGYLARGSASPVAATSITTATAPEGTGGVMDGQMPSPEQMKRMADKQAEPMLAKLKSSPNDPDLLRKIGDTYFDANVYDSAVDYYTKAIAGDPRNPAVITDRATAYLYSGDADKAISEFDRVLKIQPNYPNALFNRGMAKWKAKMDIDGAVADWEQLLKSNPNYEQRDNVQQMIVQAKKHVGIKSGQKSSKPAM